MRWPVLSIRRSSAVMGSVERDVDSDSKMDGARRAEAELVSERC
ncbi:Hypothetical protein A7982_06220 [Minicystis rosea]|nr:Hypothetical protein A7982_06220 [Minicystis rosea]